MSQGYYYQNHDPKHGVFQDDWTTYDYIHKRTKKEKRWSLCKRLEDFFSWLYQKWMYGDALYVNSAFSDTDRVDEAYWV